MKKSAWYHKLWRNKLDDLPVNSDADAAWANMRQLLDEQLPSDKPDGAGIVKPLVTRLVTFLGYVLPAAAMIGTATYFVAPKLNRHQAEKGNIKPARHAQKKLSDAEILKKDSSSVSKYSVLLDTGKASDSRVYTDSSTAQTGMVLDHNLLIYGSGSNYQAADKSLDFKNSSLNYLNTANKNGLLKRSFNAKHKKTSSEQTISVQSSNEFMNEGVKSSSYLKSNKHTQGRYNILNEQIISTAPSDFDRKEILINHFIAHSLSAAVIHTGTLQNRLDAVGIKNGKTIPNEDKMSLFSQSGFKVKKPKTDIITPAFNYGIEVGINAGSASNNLYTGLLGSYALNKRILIGGGLRINTLKTLSGTYSHPSYFRPDSASAFTINDARKVLAFDVPINLEYKMNNWLSILAGPVISFNVKQSNRVTGFEPIANSRDTLYHSKQIDSAIKATSINKMNIGFIGGASFHFKHFSLDTRYQLLTPYKVSSGLGAYKKAYQSLQLGISYHFK